MCKSMLEEGHVLAVSPGNLKCIKDFSYLFVLGGVREALFGDHNYHLIWKERRGFAKVAIEAKTVNRRIFLNLSQMNILIRLLFQCLQKIVEKLCVL